MLSFFSRILQLLLRIYFLPYLLILQWHDILHHSTNNCRLRNICFFFCSAVTRAFNLSMLFLVVFVFCFLLFVLCFRYNCSWFLCCYFLMSCGECLRVEVFVYDINEDFTSVLRFCCMVFISIWFFFFCSYHFLAHTNPYQLHSFQCILRSTLSWRRLYALWDWRSAHIDNVLLHVLLF